MLFLFEGTGDGMGMEFVILLSGSLNFDGANGGFLSVDVFCAWLDVDKAD